LRLQTDFFYTAGKTTHIKKKPFSSSMIKHILMDWDGTIIDSEPLWLEAHKTVYTKYGVKFEIEEWAKRFFS